MKPPRLPCRDSLVIHNRNSKQKKNEADYRRYDYHCGYCCETPFDHEHEHAAEAHVKVSDYYALRVRRYRNLCGANLRTK